MNICVDAHDIGIVGGIERFVANLTNELSRRGHKIFLFTYSKPGTKACFQYPKTTTFVHYFFSGDQHHIPYLRQQILTCEPDVFVSPASYNNHILWCTALMNTGIPLVYSEHANPACILKERWKSEDERSAILNAADAVHLLLPAYINSVPPFLHDRIWIIPHALQTPGRQHDTRHRPYTILSLGRLDAIKQNEILLHAFACLLSEFPDWQLEIWGDGGEKKRLQSIIEDLKLHGKARLCGQAHKPNEQYEAADIFCLPSRSEGFSLVTLEAMTNGLPVVGFAHCEAFATLVKNGINGLIAPEMTAQSLADTLRPLMSDKELRQRLGANAKKEAEKYASEKVYDQWENMLEQVAHCKCHTKLQACLNEELDNDSKQERYVQLLRVILRRKNVLLSDKQWFRRLTRRYKLLTSAARYLNNLRHRYQQRKI